MEPATVKLEHQGSTVIARVRGALDMASAPPLSARLAGAARDGRHDVVLDLGGVDFVDSIGLAMLLNTHRRTARAGVGLAVCCGPGAARRAIKLAGLEESLQVRDDLLAAMSAARERSGLVRKDRRGAGAVP